MGRIPGRPVTDPKSWRVTPAFPDVLKPETRRTIRLTEIFNNETVYSESDLSLQMGLRKQAIFEDRADAGIKLAERLQEYRDNETAVFAIPHGGVPVSVEVARGLGAYLDMVVPRKITIPRDPEAGYGAVTEDGSIVLNISLVKRLGLTEKQIRYQAEEVRAEIRRRSVLYHRKLQTPPVTVKTAIIVDDGLASGYTALAAVKSIRLRNIPTIVVASPAVSGTAYDLIKPEVDDLVYIVLSRSYPFAVASFYKNWHDLSGDEVIEYLENWKQPKKA